MTTPVDVVRVFTDDDGRFGNELGVIRASEETVGREQSIALELGFSETVFLEGVDDGVATIRIFTPASELPFAGHPSVGTAWWLSSLGTPVSVLREKAGDVAVRYDGDLTWITGRAEWAPEFQWHALASAAEVDALDGAAFPDGKHYLWAWVDEAAGVLRSRMFAPSLGVPEDEATGAAAVRLTAQLGRNLTIRQGAGSRITTRLRDGGLVDVAGRTVFDRAITI